MDFTSLMRSQTSQIFVTGTCYRIPAHLSWAFHNTDSKTVVTPQCFYGQCFIWLLHCFSCWPNNIYSWLDLIKMGVINTVL